MQQTCIGLCNLETSALVGSTDMVKWKKMDKLGCVVKEIVELQALHHNSVNI